MKIAIFQWPDDLDANERLEVPRIEARCREHVSRLSTSTTESQIFEVLDQGLRNIDRAPSRLLHRLRLVVALDATIVEAGVRRIGLRVRFTWTRYEREARAFRADVAARGPMPRPDATVERNRALVAALVEEAERGDPPRELAPEELDATRAAMTWGQWGSRRDERGVCSLCQAGPTMWCDTVVHDEDRARAAAANRAARAACAEPPAISGVTAAEGIAAVLLGLLTDLVLEDAEVLEIAVEDDDRRVGGSGHARIVDLRARQRARLVDGTASEAERLELAAMLLMERARALEAAARGR